MPSCTPETAPLNDAEEFSIEFSGLFGAAESGSTGPRTWRLNGFPLLHLEFAAPLCVADRTGNGRPGTRAASSFGLSPPGPPPPSVCPSRGELKNKPKCAPS